MVADLHISKFSIFYLGKHTSYKWICIKSAEILKNNKGADETAKAVLEQYEAILLKHKSDLTVLQQQLSDVDMRIAELEK